MGRQPAGHWRVPRLPRQVEETQTKLRRWSWAGRAKLRATVQFFTSLHIPDATTEQSRSHNDLLRMTTSPTNAGRLLRTFFESDVRELLPLVRCPTLVLHARQDAILPFDEGRKVAAYFPAHNSYRSKAEIIFCWSTNQRGDNSSRRSTTSCRRRPLIRT